MEYQYLYQTKDNENRSGRIRARSREDAYARLRRLGIRPYRLIGENPPAWKWPALWGACGALALALAGALAYFLASPGNTPLGRRQLEGDRATIDAGVYSGWIDVLPSALDRRLAAYAQPGRVAIPPDLTEDEIAALEGELGRELVFAKGEKPEHRMLKRILLKMRADMKEYLDMGGTVGDYLEFLDERQDQEHEFRERALDAVLRAPESMRERVLLGVNARLRDMAMEPVVPEGGTQR